MQLMNKQQELSISKAGTVGNVRIIDEAETAIRPIKPQKALIVLLALLLGAAGAASVVLLRAAFHRGINDIDTTERRGINVYATVPLSPWQVKRNREQRHLLPNPAAGACRSRRWPNRRICRWKRSAACAPACISP